MTDPPPGQRVLSAVAALVLVVTLCSGVAAAQSGTTTVESGETVSGISGVYGTIIVEGTVEGDVSGLAGNIVVSEDGVVEGDLEAAAGNVRIEGTVRGSVSTGAGAVTLAETGLVEGDFEVGAGEVRIDGTIEGDAKIGAETIRLGDDASVAGSLRYDGSLEGNRDAVAGEITRDRTLGGNLATDVQPVATWVFIVSSFLVNLTLGVLLVGLFPRFSTGVANRVRTDTLRSGLAGLVAIVTIPFVLVLIAISVVGIPISLVGLLAFAVFAWVGLVYGRLAVGVWLLSLVGIDNTWAGLVVGLLVAIGLGQIPLVGGLLNFVIFVLGLGAVVLGLVRRRRRLRTPSGPTATDAPAD